MLNILVNRSFENKEPSMSGEDKDLFYTLASTLKPMRDALNIIRQYCSPTSYSSSTLPWVDG